MQYLSLLIPIAYLGILLGSLATFSYAYRQRQVTAKLRLAPYFPPHTARNIYLSLLHLQDNDAASPKVPDSVLRAALLARAIEDIRRIMEIRTRKPALTQLVQRGVVGDEMMQRLQRAEQELEIELKDVVAEANALAAGWGTTIFQSAGEMAQNQMLREKLEKVKETIPAEQQAWERQRESARMELEGEISGGGANAHRAADTTTPATAALSSTATTTPEKPHKATSSDEDAVLVETPGIDTAASGGGGKNKKKKNKK